MAYLKVDKNPLKISVERWSFQYQRIGQVCTDKTKLNPFTSLLSIYYAVKLTINSYINDLYSKIRIDYLFFHKWTPHIFFYISVIKLVWFFSVLFCKKKKKYKKWIILLLLTIKDTDTSCDAARIGFVCNSNKQQK